LISNAKQRKAESRGHHQDELYGNFASFFETHKTLMRERYKIVHRQIYGSSTANPFAGQCRFHD
jgi:hypothetical protein